MAMSTDINLPRYHIARFPDRCVVCGGSSPTSHVRLVTGTLGWWTWTFWWFGRPFSVKAPACPSCAWKLHGMRFLSLLVTMGIAVVVAWFIWPHFKESVPSGLQRWAKLGLALACLMPLLLFEVYFPKPFDVTAYAESVDYEFKSIDYAFDFVTHNRDAEWVKMDGTPFFEQFEIDDEPDE